MLEIVRFLLSIKECSKAEIVLFFFSAGTELSGLHNTPLARSVARCGYSAWRRPAHVFGKSRRWRLTAAADVKAPVIAIARDDVSARQAQSQSFCRWIELNPNEKLVPASDDKGPTITLSYPTFDQGCERAADHPVTGLSFGEEWTVSGSIRLVKMDCGRRRLQALSSHLGTKCLTTRTTTGSYASPYTFDNGVLSAEELAQYDRDGFVVRRGVVDRESVDVYRERFRQLCSGEAECPGLTIMRDVAISKSEFVPGERAVTKLQNFQDDDVLFGFCQHPAIVNVVKAFTGDDVMAMHTMLINKPPDPGSRSSRHPLHQDLHYFPFRPADRVVCAWTALEHIHRQNGCLVVIPGTHRRTLLAHGYPKWEGGVNKMYHGIVDEVMEEYKDDQRVYLEMDAGDTVFFHPLLIHGSGRNRTNGFRKAISCHYASSHCFYVDVSGGTQSEIAEETKELARNIMKKRGISLGEVDLDYADIWRIRARLVAGQVGALS